MSKDCEKDWWMEGKGIEEGMLEGGKGWQMTPN